MEINKTFYKRTTVALFVDKLKNYRWSDGQYHVGRFLALSPVKKFPAEHPKQD